MQPLISPVDHESRHNSHCGDDAGPSESTPLLNRFPQERAAERRNLATSITVGLLLTILLSGVVIGTYLLIEQGQEENVLPPVEMAVQLVARPQWQGDDDGLRPVEGKPLPARRLVVVQTDSNPCSDTAQCAQLLREIEKSNSSALSHNFVVSSGGQSFEVRGWRRRSRMFPEYEDALVVGFIGNFTESPPTRTQLEEAKRLLDESVSHQYLAPNYTIIGRRTKETPKYLFDELKKLPNYDFKLSDI